MSYDVSIGGEDFNFTYNTSSLFHAHLPGGINALHGKTGKQAAKEISAFWESLNQERHTMWRHGQVGEPNLCAKYDSRNGWGSLVGGMCFLGMIQGACLRHPRARVRVC